MSHRSSPHNPLCSPRLSHNDENIEQFKHDPGHNTIDAKKLLSPAGEQLVPDGKGNMQFLGQSSDYGVTSEAQKLVGARKRFIMQRSEREGSRFSTGSGSSHHTVGDSNGTRTGDHQISSPTIGGGVGAHDMPISHGSTNEEQDDAEDEEKLLSGMAHQFGDARMSVRGEMIGNSRHGLSEFDQSRLGAEHGFYIPTVEEEELLIGRIKRATASGTPVVATLPSIDTARKVFRSPQSFYFTSSSVASEETESKKHETAWPTIVFTLAYYFLGTDATNDSNRIKRDRKLRKYMASNAWNSFRDVKMFLTPNMLNIQALQLLSMVANDMCNTGLSWMLVCQCCRLAQAMGLHRKMDRATALRLTASEAEQRKRAFWTLYTLDTCYSLSLGRTSCFEDYDCDCELPYVPDTLLTPEDKPRPEEVLGHFWPRYLIATIELSKLRSAVYRKLYAAKAAGAVSGLFSEAEAAVWELDDRLRGWKNSYLADLERMNFGAMIPPSHPSASSIEIAINNLLFSYWTIITLIHRRIFRPTFEPEENNASILSDREIRSRNILLNSARAAIETLFSISQRHNNYFKMKWAIQHQPFTPFFVLFSKIVSSPNSLSNERDLKIMGYLATFLKNLYKVARFLDEADEADGPSTPDGAENTRGRNEYFEGDGFEKYVTIVNAFMRVGQIYIRRDKLLAEKQQKERTAVKKEDGMSDEQEENLDTSIHGNVSGDKSLLKQVEIKDEEGHESDCDDDGDGDGGGGHSDWGRLPTSFSASPSYVRASRHKRQLHQSNLPLGACSPSPCRSTSGSSFSQQRQQQQERQSQQPIGSSPPTTPSSLLATDNSATSLTTLDPYAQQQQRQHQHTLARFAGEGDAPRQPQLNPYPSTPSVFLQSQHQQQNHRNLPLHQHFSHDQKHQLQQASQYAYSYPPSSVASIKTPSTTSEIPEMQHQPHAQAQAQAQPNNHILQTSSFSRQHFAYPAFTFSQLQNLATMDLDLDVGMSGVESGGINTVNSNSHVTNNNMHASTSSSAFLDQQQLGTYSQEHGYFPSAHPSQYATPTQPLQPTHMYPSSQQQMLNNSPQYSQLPTNGSGGGPTHGSGLDINMNTNPNMDVNMGYMQIIETAVRQGAMDFDWINWEH